MNFPSSALGREQGVNVISPGRLTEDGRCYTLFLLHGMTDDHHAWPTKSKIKEYVADLPLLVVMPDADDSFYMNSVEGRYETFVMEELVSWADANHPTIRASAGRATAGLSMGGWGALTLAMRHPYVFGGAASHSGAVMFDRQRHDLSNKLFGEGLEGELSRRAHSVLDLGQKMLIKNEETGRLVYSGPAIYIDCGVDDFLYAQNRLLVDGFRALEIPYEYHEYPGGHEWPYWDLHIRDVLRFHGTRWGEGFFGGRRNL